MDFHQNLLCLRYRAGDQLQKKFQDRSSVIERKQMLGNLVYDEKKIFAVRKCGRAQGQKNAPSLK